MGHYMLWIAPLAALDTIWCKRVELGTSQIGLHQVTHLRRCSDADTTKQCLSREKDASIPSWPTIMGH
eukprot:scaffold212_cov108-Skeletonema_dohrnii-CCMP3373.AAC.17